MDFDLGVIDLVDLHAVEETIRYTEQHGTDATYDKLIKHLSWYWNQQYVGGERQERKPKGWVLDWIKCLTGEL